jgi:hypothetical protein
MPATLVRLCLLRAGPQDLPHSPLLLVVSFALQLGANVLALADRLAPGPALLAAGAYTLTLVALVHTTLLLRDRGQRAVQTLAAVNLVDALIGAAGWAAGAVLGALLPAGVIEVPFLVWFIAVLGHVLRHALDVRYGLGLGLAVLYFLFAGGMVGAFVELPPPTR